MRLFNDILKKGRLWLFRRCKVKNRIYGGDAVAPWAHLGRTRPDASTHSWFDFPHLPVCPTLYSNFAHLNPGSSLPLTAAATPKVGFGSAEALGTPRCPPVPSLESAWDADGRLPELLSPFPGLRGHLLGCCLCCRWLFPRSTGAMAAEDSNRSRLGGEASGLEIIRRDIINMATAAAPPSDRVETTSNWGIAWNTSWPFSLWFWFLPLETCHFLWRVKDIQAAKCASKQVGRCLFMN